jgi:hypothetical protein
MTRDSLPIRLIVGGAAQSRHLVGSFLLLISCVNYDNPLAFSEVAFSHTSRREKNSCPFCSSVTLNEQILWKITYTLSVKKYLSDFLYGLDQRDNAYKKANSVLMRLIVIILTWIFLLQDFFFFFFFFFCSTAVWTQGLHLELLHQPFFCDGFFEIWSLKLFVQAGWTKILRTSSSWVTRIAGVSLRWPSCSRICYISHSNNAQSRLHPQNVMSKKVECGCGCFHPELVQRWEGVSPLSAWKSLVVGGNLGGVEASSHMVLSRDLL